MSIQAKQIIINDLLVNYYHRAGREDKPTLVFLHGWRSEGAVWNGVIAQLGDGYTVYALDLPGFGRSPAPENFTLQDYADVVGSFIKKNNLQNIIIIGHSFGGRIAIKLAAAHPYYLKKIILVDSAGIRTVSQLRSVKKATAKLLKPMFALPFLKNIHKKIYKQLGAEDYLATPKLQQTFVNIVNEDLTPLLSKVIVPALLVWGSDDKDTPLAYARIMEQSIPNVQLEVLQGAGHFSFLDKPNEFVKELTTFFTSPNQ